MTVFAFSCGFSMKRSKSDPPEGQRGQDANNIPKLPITEEYHFRSNQKLHNSASTSKRKGPASQPPQMNTPTNKRFFQKYKLNQKRKQLIH